MKLLKSYFWWTYERGSVHFDVMVTLILLFLFVSPQLHRLRRKAGGERCRCATARCW